MIRLRHRIGSTMIRLRHRLGSTKIRLRHRVGSTKIRLRHRVGSTIRLFPGCDLITMLTDVYDASFAEAALDPTEVRKIRQKWMLSVGTFGLNDNADSLDLTKDS